MVVCGHPLSGNHAFETGRTAWFQCNERHFPCHNESRTNQPRLVTCRAIVREFRCSPPCQSAHPAGPETVRPNSLACSTTLRAVPTGPGIRIREFQSRGWNDFIGLWRFGLQTVDAASTRRGRASQYTANNYDLFAFRKHRPRLRQPARKRELGYHTGWKTASGNWPSVTACETDQCPAKNKL